MSDAPAFPLTGPAPTRSRLEALYAFSAAQRESNPTGYAANARWWSGVIETGLATGWVNSYEATSETLGAGGEDMDVTGVADRLVLRVDEGLNKRFMWDGRTPKGLAGVVETLSTAQPQVLVPLPAYQSAITPLLAPPSLTSRFVARPLWWAVGQLNPFGRSGPITREEDAVKACARGKEYIHIALLQDAAAKYKQYVASHPPTSFSDSVYDIASFHATFGRICLPDRGATKNQGSLSRRDVELLVKWLMRDEELMVSDDKVLRILEPGQTVADFPITEVERGIASVKNALRKVELQIESVELQITACQTKAKVHLANDQRSLAASQLRTKKALGDVLVKRYGVVEQLRGVIRGIDQASSDAEVMAAYEQSTATLKTLLANPLLDRDRVDNTTEALAETLADQREIDEAIQQGGQVAMAAGGRVAADEDELEKELADMVQAEKDRAKEEAEAKDKAKVEQEKEEEKERVDKEHSKLADLTVAPRTDIARLLPNATSGSITSDMTAEQLEEQYAAARSRQIADKERMERLGRDQARQSEMAAE